MAERDEIVQRARKDYRDSDEGKAAHRDEEQRRRDKRARGELGVGDRRCEEEPERVELPAVTAAYEVASESHDANETMDWVVVAWPGLFEQARAMLGNEVVCPRCGSRGRVAQVVELNRWRRCHVGCK